ncbi:MAG: hypothetical protein U9R25_19220 [Chloroflexota bacterium]|nr:hypothetical protein [Chloroflexota bacterium]
MRRVFLPLFLILILVFVAACGGGDQSAPEDTAVIDQDAGSSEVVEPEDAEETVAPPPAPAAEEPTATPVPPTATPEPVQEEAQEDEAVITAEQLASLDDLDSYRSTTMVVTKSTGDDELAGESRVEITSEYTRDPMARYMTMSYEDLGADADASLDEETIEFYQIGDEFIGNLSGEGWIRIGGANTPFGDPNSAFLTNSGVLFSNLEDLHRIRPDEKINGMASRHYAFNENSMALWLGTDTSKVDAEGEVWIAKDGDFVTKYVLDVVVKEGGGGPLTIGLGEGSMHMEFELSDVNSDLVIEIPDEATQGTELAGFEDEGFPTPDGATVMMASAEFLTMASDLSVEDVLVFYEEVLADLGWTKNEDSSMSMGGFTSLEFTKDGQSLAVLITEDDNTGQTQIMATTE